MRLGLMGGTFDPFHWGHLLIAEQAREAGRLDKVLFIPAGQPPHKTNQTVTDAEHRYAMTIIGTATNPAFEVSRIELDSEYPSYSVDTLRRLRKIYGQEIDIRFIIGADEALDILTWHEAESLPKLTKFLVAPRPGLKVSDLHNSIPPEFASVMEILPTSIVSISSTDIRERIRDGKSIRYMTPYGVEAYILKNRLYHGADSES